MKNDGGGGLADQADRINWKEVRTRLESSRKSLERGPSLTSGEKKRILKSRAAMLARESEAGQPEQERLEVVEFQLGYETYGIETSHIREIYPLTEITSLPGAPPFIRGIVSVRGEILSVIDLKNLFDLPEKGLTDFNKIIIIQAGGGEFGLLADAVIGIRPIPILELKTSLPTMTGIRTKYLKGVTGERIIVIDAMKILSDKNIFASKGRNTN